MSEKRNHLELGENLGGRPRAEWRDHEGDRVTFNRTPAFVVAVENDGVGVAIPNREWMEIVAHLSVELPAKRMTAREHLEAAWEAAHVPLDGRIPPDTPYMSRNGGYVTAAYNGHGFRRTVPSENGKFSARLLDPPAPVWAEDEHIMATLPNGNTAMLQRIDTGWLSFDGETYTVDQLRDVKRVNVEGDEDE